MKPPETFGPIFDVAYTKKSFYCVKNWIFKVRLQFCPIFKRWHLQTMWTARGGGGVVNTHPDGALARMMRGIFLPVKHQVQMEFCLSQKTVMCVRPKKCPRVSV